ncbi:hypothetical protein HY932_02640 [Candidatus Falkowbacteria bacterium]|nr:hypothetical protein [Candidatus Falkowbacteria bacterium]
MKENVFEQQKSRLVNPDFFSEIQNAVADRLDDLATDPKLNKGGFQLDTGDKIRRGEKVKSSIMVRDAIIGVGEDFRLSRDEIDIIKSTFLEGEN